MQLFYSGRTRVFLGPYLPLQLHDRMQPKICLSHGMIDIGTLGHDIGYTDRHIRKSYKDVFSISPFYYKQIIRFQTSVHLFSSAGVYIQGDLTQISHASGYCDQNYVALLTPVYRPTTTIVFSVSKKS